MELESSDNKVDANKELSKVVENVDEDGKELETDEGKEESSSNGDEGGSREATHPTTSPEDRVPGQANLMPISSTSEGEGAEARVQGVEGGQGATFKKRKTSHRRSFRERLEVLEYVTASNFNCSRRKEFSSRECLELV